MSLKETAPASNGSSSAKAVAEAVFRHKVLLISVIAGVMLITIALTLLTPKSYRSEMNILVQNKRSDLLISPEKSSGATTPSDVTEERINSEIEVLRSKDVADAVVDPAWHAGSQKDKTEAQIKAHDKAVEDYSKHVSFELLHKSNVIHITYTAASPRKATDTLNALLKAFFAKQHELERPSGTSAFFSSEADRYKKDLDDAQQQLATYQQSRQLVSLTEKENALQTQITELQGLIRATDVQISEVANRLQNSQAQLATIPQRQATQQRSIPNTISVEQLTTTLTELRNKRIAALTKFPATDRSVQELDKQIANTADALETQNSAHSIENTTDVNPLWQQVKAAASNASTELQALRARRADEGTQLGRLQAALEDTEGGTVDYTTLQQRVTELQGNYELYTQKRNEAQIADAMDQMQLVNVAVAERPTFSAQAFKPQPVINLAMGAFTALFLAACAVFFAEMGRDTIAAPYELEAISRYPVLATVPWIAPAMETRRPRGPKNPVRNGSDPEHDQPGQDGGEGRDGRYSPLDYVPAVPVQAASANVIPAEAAIAAAPRPVEEVRDVPKRLTLVPLAAEPEPVVMDPEIAEVAEAAQPEVLRQPSALGEAYVESLKHLPAAVDADAGIEASAEVEATAVVDAGVATPALETDAAPQMEVAMPEISPSAVEAEIGHALYAQPITPEFVEKNAALVEALTAAAPVKALEPAAVEVQAHPVQAQPVEEIAPEELTRRRRARIAAARWIEQPYVPPLTDGFDEPGASEAEQNAVQPGHLVPDEPARRSIEARQPEFVIQVSEPFSPPAPAPEIPPFKPVMRTPPPPTRPVDFLTSRVSPAQPATDTWNTPGAWRYSKEDRVQSAFHRFATDPIPYEPRRRVAPPAAPAPAPAVTAPSPTGATAVSGQDHIIAAADSGASRLQRSQWTEPLTPGRERNRVRVEAPAPEVPAGPLPQVFAVPIVEKQADPPSPRAGRPVSGDRAALRAAMLQSASPEPVAAEPTAEAQADEQTARKRVADNRHTSTEDSPHTPRFTSRTQPAREPVRTPANVLRPRKAEKILDQNGKVSYVTYTVNNRD